MPGGSDSRRGSASGSSGRTIEDIFHRWSEASTTIQEQTTDVLRQLVVQSRTPAPRPAPVPDPRFDGSVPWAVFDAQFQDAAAELSWTDAEKGRRLLRALHGPAAALLQTLPPASYTNYGLLHARLKERYAPADRARVAEASFEHRRQKPGETIRDYADAVLALVREAYPTWAEDPLQTTARRAFISGLADPDVRRDIRKRDPATFAETVSATLRLEAVDQAEQPAAK